MANVSEMDFYHGILSTVLLRQNFQLVQLQSYKTRRTYKVKRGGEQFIIYAKYASKPTSENRRGGYTWSFAFTDEEIEKIKGYMKEEKNMKVALISRYNKQRGGELAILDRKEFLKCVGYGWESDNPYISVLKEKYHQLKVYGRGISRDKAIIPEMRLIKGITDDIA